MMIEMLMVEIMVMMMVMTITGARAKRAAQL